jgi:hypothetical protein
LVAATHGQAGRACRDGLTERFRLVGQVLGHERLLAILAAADVEEVDVGGQRLSKPDRVVLEADAAPGGAALENGHVAAVRIDVEVIRIQVAEDEFHAASQ